MRLTSAPAPALARLLAKWRQSVHPPAWPERLCRRPAPCALTQRQQIFAAAGRDHRGFFGARSPPRAGRVPPHSAPQATPPHTNCVRCQDLGQASSAKPCAHHLRASSAAAPARWRLPMGSIAAGGPPGWRQRPGSGRPERGLAAPRFMTTCIPDPVRSDPCAGAPPPRAIAVIEQGRKPPGASPGPWIPRRGAASRPGWRWAAKSSGFRFAPAAVRLTPSPILFLLEQAHDSQSLPPCRARASSTRGACGDGFSRRAGRDAGARAAADPGP